MTIPTQAEDLVLREKIARVIDPLAWRTYENGRYVGRYYSAQHTREDALTKADAILSMISAVPSIGGGEGDSSPSQTSPSSEVFAPLPCRPESPSPLADEVAWLIEETWSGYVHYVHRDFRCDKLAAEWRQNDWRRSYGAPARRTQPIVTKNIDEAMRFPTRDAAELWLALQPNWMKGGGQYQVREHMWAAPSTEAPPLILSGDEGASCADSGRPVPPHGSGP